MLFNRKLKVYTRLRKKRAEKSLKYLRVAFEAKRKNRLGKFTYSRRKRGENVYDFAIFSYHELHEKINMLQFHGTLKRGKK